MKIRIKGDSIRFRLSQSDVATVRDRGVLLETTSFPNGGLFDYSLNFEPVADINAFVLENGIQVVIPESEGIAWCGSEQVGISAALDLPSGGQLSVLIEKDFACMQVREGEDESDLYPNPNA